MDNKLTEYVLKHSKKRDKELKYDFMPSLLEIIERPAHKAGTVIIISIFTLLIFAVIWARCSKIDVVVTSTGSIQPVGNINVVKSYSSGTVKAINVVEGQYVNQGDILIELDTEALDIDVNQLNTQKMILETQHEIYTMIKDSKDMLSDNPCRRVRVPKGESQEKEIYTIQEIEQIFKTLENEPLKYRLYIMLAVYSGFRRSEMLGLEWKDIDFANNIITVKRTSQYTKAKGIYTDTTKTKRSKRTIKFPQLIMDLLKEFRIEQLGEAERIGSKWIDNDRLFVKWNGEPMNPQTPYGWFREFCKNNGFRFCDIHSLRHLHASLLINAGIDVVAVSGDMGHSVVGTTLNLYSHMFQEARIRNCDAITEALNFET